MSWKRREEKISPRRLRFGKQAANEAGTQDAARSGWFERTRART